MEHWFESGHVAIVTGGSRGLGLAVARELLSHGVVAIVDGRDRLALDAAHNELQRFGHVVAIRGDVADPEHVHALVAAARSFGRLDLLINNASTLGATSLPRIDELTHATFRRLFDVNVFAAIHLMQHALPLMQQSGGIATIVNVTSDAAVESYPAWGGYGASKAALEHVSRVLAAELESDRVRVLVVDPGEMDTEMHRAAMPGADRSQLRDPADAARALLDAIAKADTCFKRVALPEMATI